ncbi:MAG TPA: ATP-binding cassette domain-containing protein [Hyphomicrobiaceae bacterium]|nr:ATP-binding cassette domain-containing protein [Hyphomicrobiaceae bacterium]
MSDTPILSVRGVSKRFVRKLDLAGKIAARLGADLREETVHAVDRVDLDIRRGEVVGLVGESGCGKSTLGRMVAGLMEPSEGTVFINGVDRAKVEGDAVRLQRLAVQMIFQDPSAALNPRMRVEEIIGEAPVVHGLVTKAEVGRYVGDMLRRVGLSPDAARRYPHQFSGGQRSRINIARALAVKPEFLVCDEAIAALDVSIQAQVINLFMDLKSEFGLTYLFISHDLGVVEHISDRVVIMYLGRVVESAATEALFAGPNHPYAKALLAEVPRLSTEKRTFHPIQGEIPSPLSPPQGCHFHPRCPYAFRRCSVEVPRLREIAPGRLSACHLNDEEGGSS